jgi:hypothetical protein
VREKRCRKFCLYVWVGWDRCISAILASRVANLLLLQVHRKRWLSTSTLSIVLGQLREVRFIRARGKICRITAHVSLPCAINYMCTFTCVLGLSATEYLESVTRREIDWIGTCADPERAPETPWQYTSNKQHSPAAHVSLLREFLTATPHIVPKDPEFVSPRLWQPVTRWEHLYRRPSPNLEHHRLAGSVDGARIHRSQASSALGLWRRCNDEAARQLQTT